MVAIKELSPRDTFLFHCSKRYFVIIEFDIITSYFIFINKNNLCDFISFTNTLISSNVTQCNLKLSEILWFTMMILALQSSLLKSQSRSSRELSWWFGEILELAWPPLDPEIGQEKLNPGSGEIQSKPGRGTQRRRSKNPVN